MVSKFFSVIFLFLILAKTYAVSQAIKDCIVANWSFTGNVMDSGPNAIHGTAIGPTLTTDRNNNPNSAQIFDGAFNYIFIAEPIPAPISAIQNEISVSLWIFPTSYPTGQVGYIVGTLQDASASGFGIMQDNRVNADGFVGLPIGHIHVQFANGAFHACDTNSVLPQNQWTHLTVTRQANNAAQVYFNGFSQSIQCNSWGGGISQTNSRFLIGAQNKEYSNTYFPGKIDDIKVFNRTLTAFEVNEVQFDCTDGKQFDGQSCFPCNASCKTCEINPNNCSSCSYPYSLYEWNCVEICPEGQKNGTRCIQCAAGEFALVNHSLCVNDVMNCGNGSYGNADKKQCLTCSNVTSYGNLDHLGCTNSTANIRDGVYLNKTLKQIYACPPNQYASVDHLECVANKTLCGDGNKGDSNIWQCINCSSGFLFATTKHDDCVKADKCEYIANTLTFQCENNSNLTLIDQKLSKGKKNNELILSINSEFSDLFEHLEQYFNTQVDGVNKSLINNITVTKYQKIDNLQKQKIQINQTENCMLNPNISVKIAIPKAIQNNLSLTAKYNLSILNSNHFVKYIEFGKIAYSQATIAQTDQIQTISQVAAKSVPFHISTPILTQTSFIWGGLSYASLQVFNVWSQFQQLSLNYPQNLNDFFNSSFSPIHSNLKDSSFSIFYPEKIEDLAPPDNFSSNNLSAFLWNNIQASLTVDAILVFIGLIFFIIQQCKPDLWKEKQKAKSWYARVTILFAWNIGQAIFFAEGPIFVFKAMISLYYGDFHSIVWVCNFIFAVAVLYIFLRFAFLSMIIYFQISSVFEKIEKDLAQSQEAIAKKLKEESLSTNPEARKEYIISLIEEDKIKFEELSLPKFVEVGLYALLIFPSQFAMRNLLENYSFFFTQFKLGSKSSKFYLLFDLIRNLLVAFSFVFLWQIPLAVSFFYASQALLFLIYLLVVRPFDEKIFLIQLIFIEVTNITQGIIISIIGIQDVQLNDTNVQAILSSNWNLGTAFIWIMICSMGANFLFAVVSLILQISVKIKALCKRATAVNEDENKAKSEAENQPEGGSSKKTDSRFRWQKKREETKKDLETGNQTQTKNAPETGNKPLPQSPTQGKFELDAKKSLTAKPITNPRLNITKKGTKK